MNEMLLIIELIVVYTSILIFFKYFGLKGLYAASVVFTVLSNIEVVVLISAFGLEQTLGNVLFAVTFLVTDIVSELYSKKEAQKVVNLNIAISLVFIILSNMWTMYIPSASDTMMPAITTIFSSVPRMLIASLLVYAIVQNIDVRIYDFIWRKTGKDDLAKKDKYLFVRNNGSTLISQLINSILFTVFAFYGTFDTKTLISITIATYIIYIVTSLLDTPIIYLARKMVKNDNGIITRDKIDYDTNK